MGYYTTFEVTVSVPESVDCQIAELGLDVHEVLGKALQNAAKGYQFENTGHYHFTLYHAKWYTFDQDLKEFTKNMSNITVTVKGEGEESGDIWEAVYRNGRGQESKAKMVFWSTEQEQNERKKVLDSTVRSPHTFLQKLATQMVGRREEENSREARLVEEELKELSRLKEKYEGES